MSGGGTAAAAPGWFGAAAGAFAALVAVFTVGVEFTGRRRVLPLVNVLGTIVHEAGHASVCVLTGGGIYQVRITGPDSGWTRLRNDSPLSGIVTGMAGYAMPTLAGLGAAGLVHRGHPAAVLVITAVLMLLLLPVAKDVLTLFLLVLVGGLAFVTVRWGAGWCQDAVATTVAWLLLTSEIGGLVHGIVGRLRGEGTVGDARRLAEETHIPPEVWVAGWLALIGWGLWHAAPMLLAAN